jgi:hypothetical protein
MDKSLKRLQQVKRQLEAAVTEGEKLLEEGRRLLTDASSERRAPPPIAKRKRPTRKA